MTFVIRALVGAVATAIPASIGAIVAYRESMFGRGVKKEIKDLKDRCYVIPTEDADTNSQDKLLICTPTDEYNTHYSQYLLQRGQEIKGEGDNVISEIKKQGELLIVFWQESEGNSSSRRGLSNKKANLKVNGENWESIKENVNLISACHFVSNTEANGGKKWQCNSSSLEKGSGEVTFQLIPFSK